MMSTNGHDQLAQAIEQAKAERNAEYMLRQMLTQALNQPAKVTRVTGPSLITAAKDINGCVLLVALPTGERWDIPMDDATCRRVAFALASAKTETDAENDLREAA